MHAARLLSTVSIISLVEILTSETFPSLKISYPISLPPALKDVTVRLTDKGGKEGKLFGAITSKEIAEGLLAQHKLDVPKQKIVLDEPIKAFGTYEVRAKLGYEVSAKFTVSVAEE